MTEVLKGWRTLIVGVLHAITGILVLVGAISEDLRQELIANADAVIGTLLTVSGAVMVWLRAITDTAMGKKGGGDA